MYPAVLTVRLSSSRLPKKALLRLGGLTSLEFSVKRCQFGGMDPYVFTSDDKSDDEIQQLADRLSVPVFRGDLLNKVDRWHKGFDFFNLPDGHLVDVDDPFFDPVECKKSLDLLRESSNFKLVLPSLNSDSGAAYVGTSVTRETLKFAVEKLKILEITDTDVVPWNQIFSLDQILRSDGNTDPAHTRLTLDYPEDYTLLSLLAEKFGPSSTRQEVADYLQIHPELGQINFFRNSEFIANKIRHLNKIGAADAQRKI